MTHDNQLVLAGGGHSHALLLRHWAMHPKQRPKGLITLVNRWSTSLYSGMVPGLIAGLYSHEQVTIDLRQLAAEAEVAFVRAEIKGIDITHQSLILESRLPVPYSQLSLNVGAISRQIAPNKSLSAASLIPVKPLEPALAFLKSQDGNSSAPFHVVGSGLAGVEVALALRRRWPKRSIHLHTLRGLLRSPLQQALRIAKIVVVEQPRHSNNIQIDPAIREGLLCNGSRSPAWLATSGLPCCPLSGRVRTNRQLQVIDHPQIFASGDCGLIDNYPRPASGVWAVRAATPLAHNLEAACQGQPLRPWRPQRNALQLVGGFQAGQATAWAQWGPFLLGPHPWWWRLKTKIDQRFMQRLQHRLMHTTDTEKTNGMLCRGCAAKLPAAALESALTTAGVGSLASAPEDAAVVPVNAKLPSAPLLQSVDGFPALISDPWLNGRLTTLHACSDLWACGATVHSAQAVVTLPLASPNIQQNLLAQTLAGIRSALDPQHAVLLGGHTLEARTSAPKPCSLGLQVVLSVQGSPTHQIWSKRGIQAGDHLLISRALGTGVLFAAAMEGIAQPDDLDQALQLMNTSQHNLVNELIVMAGDNPNAIHAATDITGFGLLGHLGEMLGSHPDLQVELMGEALPALEGAIHLLEKGHCSSLAPSNRRAWSLLDPHPDTRSAAVELKLGAIPPHSPRHLALLELLVDPQTCGPLLISVDPDLAARLLAKATSCWHLIGRAKG